MTVAEVKYFTNRMKAGYYPRNKNLSPAVFMECLNDYIHEILATRGAVNSYAWRDNKTPDELYQLPTDPATGKPGKPVDPGMVRETLKGMEAMFREADRINKENDERDRKARWEFLKNQRDQQIVSLVELDAAKGIAPDKYMMQQYFECLGRLAGE